MLSLIHYRHSCIHTNQVESFLSMIFSAIFFLTIVDLIPSKLLRTNSLGLDDPKLIALVVLIFDLFSWFFFTYLGFFLFFRVLLDCLCLSSIFLTFSRELSVRHTFTNQREIKHWILIKFSRVWNLIPLFVYYRRRGALGAFYVCSVCLMIEKINYMKNIILWFFSSSRLRSFSSPARCINTTWL